MSAADGVEHKVNPRFGAAIRDRVGEEGIENPALTFSHVDGVAPAGERDVGIGDHWNVNTKVRAPIVMNVDVLGYLGPSA